MKHYYSGVDYFCAHRRCRAATADALNCVGGCPGEVSSPAADDEQRQPRTTDALHFYAANPTTIADDDYELMTDKRSDYQ